MKNLKSFLVLSGTNFYNILFRNGEEAYNTRIDLLGLLFIDEIIEDKYFGSTLDDESIFNIVRVVRRVMNNNPNIKHKGIGVNDSWMNKIKSYTDYTTEYSFKWVGDINSIEHIKDQDGNNTGQISFKRLVKVSDDEFNIPLDPFNFSSILSGIQQDYKLNLESDSDYVGPIQDLILSPIFNFSTNNTRLHSRYYPSFFTLDINSTVNSIPYGYEIVDKSSWIKVIEKDNSKIKLFVEDNIIIIPPPTYPYKWVIRESDYQCELNNDNNQTGYKIYSNLYKVSNDGNEFPLDKNNNSIAHTKLRQDRKPNKVGEVDYVDKVFDDVTCDTKVLWDSENVFKVSPIVINTDRFGGPEHLDVSSKVNNIPTEFDVDQNPSWIDILSKSHNFVELYIEENYVDLENNVIFTADPLHLDVPHISGIYAININSTIKEMYSEYMVVDKSDWISVAEKSRSNIKIIINKNV